MAAPMIEGLNRVNMLLGLLGSPNPDVKHFVLSRLNYLVHHFWRHISPGLTVIESLYADVTFQYRHLAALVASKVHFYLGNLPHSLTYALIAGPLFDVAEKSDYAKRLLSEVVGTYGYLKFLYFGKNEEVSMIDHRVEALMDRLIDKYMSEGEFAKVIQLCLDCRRLDRLEEAIVFCPSIRGALSVLLSASSSFLHQREYHVELLRLLVRFYLRIPSPDYWKLCQCLVHLNEPKGVATVLQNLVSSGRKDDILLAFQIAFDLVESEHRSFLLKVRDRLPPGVCDRTAHATTTSVNGSGDLAKIKGILSGLTSTQLSLQFLRGHYRSDLRILKIIKQPVAPRNSICHIATLSANAMMHAGTTVDKFLRETKDRLTMASKWVKFCATSARGVVHRGNLQQGRSVLARYLRRRCSRARWSSYSEGGANAIVPAGTTVDKFLRGTKDRLTMARKWVKFCATSALGVVHRGNLQQGRSVLARYLRRRGSRARWSSYSEGGALYALGLIHVNHGEGIKQFLRKRVRSARSKAIQRGACLGLGLACLGTGDEKIYEELQDVMYAGKGLAGEAAGIGMGLVMAGTGTEKAVQMLKCAQDAVDERVIRGLSLGIALTFYGIEEKADALISQMSTDEDTLIQCGAMIGIGLAYRGTLNEEAVGRLLQFAECYESYDDVRRAAALAIGFVLFRNPQQATTILTPLSDSEDDHVRCGTALALGISCAGTCKDDAIALLESLTTDLFHGVRQAAVMALAMVMMQASETEEPRVGPFRRRVRQMLVDEEEETMDKLGAILASGILDAGGRNVTIRLASKMKHDKLATIVGLAVFSQFRDSFPLVHFISLAFSPAAFLGLNYDLNAPRFQLLYFGPPSLSDHPRPSSKRRRSRKRKREEKDERGAAGSGDFFNPARVLPIQEAYVEFLPESRYVPVKMRSSGFVMLKDLRPSEGETLSLTNAPPSDK